MKLEWMCVYGFSPEEQADGSLESDDCAFFIGTEKAVDDFFQEMMFDGSYPILFKAQIVESAMKQGREEVVDQFDESGV